MKRFTLQHFWATAWKRFRQNWIAAITLLPISFLVGQVVIFTAFSGVAISVSSCSERIKRYKERQERISLPENNPLLQMARKEGNFEEAEDIEKLIERALALADSLEEAWSKEVGKQSGLTEEQIKDSLTKRLAYLEQRKARLQSLIEDVSRGNIEAFGDSVFQDFLNRHPYFGNLGERLFTGYSPDAEVDPDAVKREIRRQLIDTLREEYRQEVEKIKEEIKRYGVLEAIANAKEELQKKLEEIEEANPSFLKKFWNGFTTLILVVVYLFLALVGFVWLALGVDRLALSLNTEKGVGTLLGDVLPVPVGKIAFNYIMARLLSYLGIGVLVVAWLMIWFILTYLFGGAGILEILGKGLSLFPIFALLSLVLLIAIYLILWPLNFYILSGKNFIQAISESVRFFRSNYNSLLPFEISRLFILYLVLLLPFGKFLSPVVKHYWTSYQDLVKHSAQMSEQMSKQMSDTFSFKEYLLSYIDETGSITLLASIILVMATLAFLTLMRAAFFVEITQDAEESQAESSPSTPSA